MKKSSLIIAVTLASIMKESDIVLLRYERTRHEIGGDGCAILSISLARW